MKSQKQNKKKKKNSVVDNVADAKSDVTYFIMNDEINEKFKSIQRRNFTCNFIIGNVVDNNLTLLGNKIYLTNNNI